MNRAIVAQNLNWIFFSLALRKISNKTKKKKNEKSNDERADDNVYTSTRIHKVIRPLHSYILYVFGF